jgi:hypothetical protein
MNDEKTQDEKIQFESTTLTYNSGKVESTLAIPKNFLFEGVDDKEALKKAREYFESPLTRFSGLVSVILESKEMAPHWAKVLDEGLLEIAKKMIKVTLEPGEKDGSKLN